MTRMHRASNYSYRSYKALCGIDPIFRISEKVHRSATSKGPLEDPLFQSNGTHCDFAFQNGLDVFAISLARNNIEAEN